MRHRLSTCENTTLIQLTSVVLTACAAVPLACNAAPPQPLTQPWWVFPDSSHAHPITDATARQTLISNSAVSNVDALYVSVYHHRENSAGRRLYDEAAIADLITRAHAGGSSNLWPTSNNGRG